MKIRNEYRLLTMILCGIFFILSLCSFLFLYKDGISPNREKEIVYTERDPGDQVFWLKNGETLSLMTTPCSDSLDGIGLDFDVSYYEQTSDEAAFRIEYVKEETGEVLGDWDLRAEDVGSHVFWQLYFSDGEKKVERGENYLINITVTQGERIGLHRSVTIPADPTYLNGTELTDTPIAYRLFGGNAAGLKPYFVGLFLIWLFLFAAFVIVMVFRVPLRNAVIPVGLLLGLLYMAVFPPLTTPDGLVHYNSAYLTSSRILHAETETDEGIRLARAADYEMIESFRGAKRDSLHADFYAIADEQLHADADQTMIEADEMTLCTGASGWAYAPQVLGLVLGRLLGLNGLLTYQLGRFFMLLLFVFGVWLAMAKMPFAELLPAGVFFLPIVMQQVVSYNYDTLLFLAVILLAAELLHLIFSDEPIGILDLLLIAASLFFIGVTKAVYLVLLLLGVLIPKEKFGSGKQGAVRKWLFAGAFLVIGFLSYYLFRTGITADVLRQSPGTLSLNEEGRYSLGVLAAYPGHSAAVLMRTLLRKTADYFGGALGTQLGDLSFGISGLLLVGYSTVLLLAAQRRSGEDVCIERKERLVIGGVLVLTWLVVILSMLLGWTKTSSSVTEGVQGRYFVPVLLPAVLLFRNRIVSLGRNMNRFLFGSLVVLQTFTVLEVLCTALQR